MMQATPISEMIAALRPLLGGQDITGDFAQPSLLREVPSISAPDSNYKRAVREYAELGGSAGGDR